MSEQKKPSYFEELDRWTDANVIQPLHWAIVEGDSGECDTMGDQVKHAIQQKVLESYKNGLNAGRRPAREPKKGAVR